MKFSTKVFLTVFGGSAISSLAICCILYSSTATQQKEQFLRAQQSQLLTVKDTLHQLESASDLIARDAALALRERDKEYGVASNIELSSIAKNLNVAHIFITDNLGNFIRSTNGEVSSFRNSLFDYCSKYKELLTGKSQIEQTPIVPSADEASPGLFKYTMIPNYNRSRVLEVSVSLQFISQTLAKAIHANRNITQIGLYSPNGRPLGVVTGDENIASITTDPLSILDSGPVWSSSNLVLAERVEADTTQCCECTVKNIPGPSHNYFYILVAKVSSSQLAGSILMLQIRVTVILLITLLTSFLVSKKISNQLLRRLQVIKAGVSTIAEKNNLSLRLGIQGSDEIARLGEQIDRMTASLQESQTRLVEAERESALARVAAQFAHDIRSPIAALNVATYDSSILESERQELIHAAIGRIKCIASSLLERYRHFSKRTTDKPDVIAHPPESMDVWLASDLVKSTLAEKRLQYKCRTDVSIDLHIHPKEAAGFVSVRQNEFNRALSNLIDNSFDAISGHGRINVNLKTSSLKVHIEVKDDGKGIPAEVLKSLVAHPKSYAKPTGTGLGLAHAIATIDDAGGTLEIRSDGLRGTTVTITLPRSIQINQT